MKHQFLLMTSSVLCVCSPICGLDLAIILLIKLYSLECNATLWRRYISSFVIYTE